MGNPRRDEKPEAYAREAKEFLRTRLFGRQVSKKESLRVLAFFLQVSIITYDVLYIVIQLFVLFIAF